MAYQSAWPAQQGSNVWAGGGGYTQPGAAPRPGMAYVSPWAPEAAASYFTDPLSQPIMQAWSGRMGGAQQWNAPGFGDVEAMMRSAAQPNKYFDQAAGSLGGLVGSTAGATNEYTPQFAQSVAKRKKELYQDPFSTAEDAALKARYFDSLSATRDDRAQQMAEMLAQRGFANSSGLAADAMSQVETSYQTDRAHQQQSLMQYVMDEREKRRNLAVEMAGQLSHQGYEDATLAAQNLQTRSSIAGALANLGLGLQRSQLEAAQGIGGFRQQDFTNRQGLYDTALQTSMLPYTLQVSRLGQLTSALGGEPNAYNMVSGYNQQANQQQQFNAGQNAAMWKGIAGAAGGFPWGGAQGPPRYNQQWTMASPDYGYTS